MAKRQPPRKPLPTEPQSEIERRAYVVLSRVYLGIHHVDGWCRRISDPYWVRVTVPGELGTYDFAEMTRLVIAAHDECVRVAAFPAGPRNLQLVFSLRGRPGRFLDTSLMDTHPTMEQAIAANRRWRWQVEIRGTGGYRG